MDNSQTTLPPVKERPKPCCACPETRKLRDQCMIEKDEQICFKEIENHKVCLRQHGFDA